MIENKGVLRFVLKEPDRHAIDSFFTRYSEEKEKELLEKNYVVIGIDRDNNIIVADKEYYKYRPIPHGAKYKGELF